MRKDPRLVGTMILLAVVLSVGTVVKAGDQNTTGTADSKPIMLAPNDVNWGLCPPAVPPGAQCAVIEGDLNAANKLFAFRVKMPGDFRIMPHFHPAEEHVVVLSGVFNMAMGENFTTDNGHAMSAGSFMVMPKEQPHFAWTTGETIIQVYAIGPWGLTYVNPADDPRSRSLTE